MSKLELSHLLDLKLSYRYPVEIESNLKFNTLTPLQQRPLLGINFRSTQGHRKGFQISPEPSVSGLDDVNGTFENFWGFI